jgi:hypothetical protein
MRYIRFKTRTIIKAQTREMKRANSYRPFLEERTQLNRDNLTHTFERLVADGESFIPEKRLPPWMQRNFRDDSQPGVSRNFAGFRVRTVPQQHGSAFPTHFQQ